MRISDWSSDVCSSDLLVILGIAFFIVGGVIVFLLTDDDDGDSASYQARPVSVVVATNEVAAGALADELIEQGGLRVVEIEVGEMVPGAVQSLNQLRSEEHTSELQSLMRISYAVFCLKKKKKS